MKDIIDKLITILNADVEPLTETEGKYSSLLNKIGGARFVLMGEASHGTHEFYQARAEISKELILKKGFQAIAIEGDWPDVYRIHRYIQGQGAKSDWQQAVSEFKRFPRWMWRNKALVPFIQWLRTYNDTNALNQIKK